MLENVLFFIQSLLLKFHSCPCHLNSRRQFVGGNDPRFVLIWPVKDACSGGTCVRMEVSGIFHLPNVVKYPFIIHVTLFGEGSLMNRIVDLAQAYASFIVTPPRHVEAPGH